MISMKRPKQMRTLVINNKMLKAKIPVNKDIIDYFIECSTLDLEKLNEFLKKNPNNVNVYM